jgi:uncharacterized protein
MRLPVSFRFSHFISVSLFLAWIFASSISAQQTTRTERAKPKIRAITAFVNLERDHFRVQISDAVAMLKRAQTIFESRGYQVQSIRIATQPFPQYTKGMTAEQTVAFFKEYDALAIKEQFAASIGPAMLKPGDGMEQAELLATIMSNTKLLNGTVVVAGEDGVRWPAVGAAARVMKELENSTDHSQGNFRFAAIAMVPPLTPFFPAAYHTGFGHQFTVGLESANVVEEAFTNAPDILTARQRLTGLLAAAAFDIQSHAERIDSETGWTYMGIDLSPAPSGSSSIGAAIEKLTAQPFGSSGTLTAAATITSGIKDVKVKQAGYSGMMLPMLEDSRLAQRWNEGRISLDALLSYSSVCATGLDTIPLAGDTSEEQLSLIIGDMASLAVKWQKPLAARLLPAKGKEPGELTDFDDPFLVNAKIQQLNWE